MSNQLESPRRKYPGQTGVIKAHLKKTIGVEKSFQGEPIMAQDAKHLIDVCWVVTPQALQSELNVVYYQLDL